MYRRAGNEVWLTGGEDMKTVVFLDIPIGVCFADVAGKVPADAR